MFQSAFRRLTKQYETLANGGVADVTPSTSPKPEGTQPSTPEIPAQTQPQPQATVASPSNPDVPVEASNNVDDSLAGLVQDSREIHNPFDKGDEALKLRIEPSAEQAERSSEPTLVDSPTADPAYEQDHGAEKAQQLADVFDTTSRGASKGDLWALAAEMEAMQKEKLELQGKIDGMLKQVAEAEEREKRVMEEADHLLKKVAELETLLDEEKKKVVQAEAEGKSQLVSLEHRLQDELEKAKAESRKDLETALDRLASSEERERRAKEEADRSLEKIAELETLLNEETKKVVKAEADGKSQLVSLENRLQDELEKAKAESKKDLETALDRLASSEERERRVKEEADRSLKKMAELETLLNEEKKKVVKAETEGKSQLVSLENRLKDELEKAKAESREDLQTALDKLASSEKRAEELGSVDVEEALRAERDKAGEVEGTLRSQVAAAHAKVEDYVVKYDEAARQIAMLEQKVKELELAKPPQVAEERDEKQKKESTGPWQVTTFIARLMGFA